MPTPPRWFIPVCIAALLWNIAGMVAVVGDLRMSAADIAQLSADQQAMVAARTWWSVTASLTAVIGGCLGCLALLWRSRRATVCLIASLAGLIVQDIGLILVLARSSTSHTSIYAVQGCVLLIAWALLRLARSAQQASWLR